MSQEFTRLVQADKGLIDRKIFTDPEVYKWELEQVFGRSWLFLGHESQVRNPNDFIGTYMAEDPVLMTRDTKGHLHAFLNMCRHRGNRICRADYGNAPSFMCTYHGWTFDTSGKLVGVPGYKEAYFEELDRSQWGLVEVAQLDTYKGLIFATWDKRTPDLLHYLGNMTWYMDLVLDRRDSGTELVGGVHKWIMNSNWKLSADNFGGDTYHHAITHGSTYSLGGWMTRSQRPVGNAVLMGGYSVHPGNGHCVVGFGGPTGGAGAVANLPPEAREYFLQHIGELESRLGSTRAKQVMGSVATVFPNMSFIHSRHGIRVWHPRGPDKTEIWAYCILDKDSPVQVKEAMRRHLTLTFGPAGVVEQDDMNNWAQCTASGMSWAGRRYAMNIQLGLGHEHYHEEIPGLLGPSPSELNHRGFYSHWAQMMDASSWEQIKLQEKQSLKAT